MDLLLFIILITLFLIEVLPLIFSEDKAMIWSPMTFLCVYLTYYILIPYLNGGAGASIEGQTYLLFGTLLFYIVFKLVFKLVKTEFVFTSYNSAIYRNNAKNIALLLFVLAFIGYGVYKGFSLSVFSEVSREDLVFDKNASYGHSEMYILNLISVFTTACALLYAYKNKINILFLFVLFLTLIIYIIGGFRYRILLLFVTVLTVIYLYPYPRNVKYHIIVPLFIIIYLGMGVMEATRMYGKGLDQKRLVELKQKGTIKESKENMLVYEFSAECMSKYTLNDLILFEPISTAICMPIPRSIFPEKPKGDYLRNANIKVYGTITRGNAFLNITEAYLSFWWVGIIFYAAFLGWLSKIFWNNYLLNPSSLGAIVLLGLYNATLYQIIARGYMAQALTTFIYYVFVPFWLIFLFEKIKTIRV